MKVAIGPSNTLPSWKWVGEDTITELSKHFTVATFSGVTPPKADVILVIKQLPPDTFLAQARRQGSKVVYVPIDYFVSKELMESKTASLRDCDMIISHSARLIPFFSSCTRTEYIDHNGKYFLDEPASFKENGYVLWVGGFQFIPYLLEFLHRHPIDAEIRVLADYKNPAATNCAGRFSGPLGIDLYICGDSCNGLQLFDWSVEQQEKMLNEAKAAIDIKGLDFHQMHKPPTKAQKYVCSGVPFAINKESEAYPYFVNKRFTLCEPQDTKRWFSKEYWQETQDCAQHLRPLLSTEAIGNQYRAYIETI